MEFDPLAALLAAQEVKRELNKLFNSYLFCFGRKETNTVMKIGEMKRKRNNLNLRERN